MPDSIYESSPLLAQYLLFHYGPESLAMPWAFGPREALGFPVRCVTECVDAASLPADARALDAGCAVGRSTLELSRFCREAVGFDYSHTFIVAASTLCRDGELHFEAPEYGMMTTPAVARLPEGIDLSRVRFRREDAERLPEDLGVFDVVLAANLLCRLPHPDRFLERLPSLLRPGGQLVITTPHTWSEDFTAPAFWIGGTPDSGAPLDALNQRLHPHFDLAETKDLPFCIREHARKFQWSVAQTSVWRRRDTPAE